jgi:coniferyl-aldehyde dehydrogenase
MKTIFEQQKAASVNPDVPWSVREDRLRRLRKLILENQSFLIEAINQDFGNRNETETTLLEIFPSLKLIGDCLSNGKKWMKPESRATNFLFWPGSSQVIKQPLGVVGIICPWNYPMLMMIAPLAGAFAAGNRAMCKLSEFTPHISALLAKLVTERFAPDELHVVNGDGAVASEFSALPFDHLFFTGSTKVGRWVMKAASDNLTPVTLELGGKSPAIVSSQADMKLAVKRLLVGKCYNAGQTCIAPDYILLQRPLLETFLTAAKATLHELYPDFANNTDFCSLIHDNQFKRIAALEADAVAKGAQVIRLSNTEPNLAKRQYPPTLLTQVNDSMDLLQEEIFGPLLPIILIDSIDEAVAHINARPHPLALYVFSEDKKEVAQVLAQTRAGGVTVNDTILHIAQNNLPFGGVGPSGMGHYHGYDGFLTFSKSKAVFTQSRFAGTKLFYPPYTAKVKALIQKVI